MLFVTFLLIFSHQSINYVFLNGNTGYRVYTLQFFFALIWTPYSCKQKHISWTVTHVSACNYCTCAIISCSLYSFYPIFHCSSYSKEANTTDNLLLNKEILQTNLLCIIKGGFKARVGYNGGNTAYKNLGQVHNAEVGLLHCIIYLVHTIQCWEVHQSANFHSKIEGFCFIKVKCEKE